MIIIEEVIHYNKQGLYDLIQGKEDINDFTKDLLCNYVDDMSIQIAEIGSQINRLPMDIDVHRQYSELKTKFVQCIMDLLEIEITEVQKDRILNSYLGNVYDYVSGLTNMLPFKIYKNVENCYDTMSIVTDKFKTESQGLVDEFEQNVSEQPTINISNGFNYFNNKSKSDIDEEDFIIDDKENKNKTKSNRVKKYVFKRK